jgi:hypothetical protein
LVLAPGDRNDVGGTWDRWFVDRWALLACHGHRRPRAAEDHVAAADAVGARVAAQQQVVQVDLRGSLPLRQLDLGGELIV